MLVEGVVTGSGALPPAFLGRPAGKDKDFICTPRALDYLMERVEDFGGGLQITYPSETKVVVRFVRSLLLPVPGLWDIELALPGSTGEEFLELVGKYELATRGELLLPQLKPAACLALKLTHRFKDHKFFHKTMRDIKHLRGCAVSVPPFLAAWMARREKESLARRAPSLALPKASFFTSNVPYIYDHDTLHLAVAGPGGPIYKRFQREGAEVMVDKEKWAGLPPATQRRSVMEEAMVLALERHQIPNDFRPDPERSFRIAMQKVCTSISSGWWREFAWENHDKVIEEFLLERPDYVRAFQAALSAGIVLPYSGAPYGAPEGSTNERDSVRGEGRRGGGDTDMAYLPPRDDAGGR